MDIIEYSSIRHIDHYAEADSDGTLEDSMFWCTHFRYIHDDVYATLKIRPMHPMNLTEAQSKSRLHEALDVTGKMGLHHLMTLQCHYDSSVVKPFFSTLVTCGDELRTMKWMIRTTMIQSDFRIFGQVLRYAFHGRDTASGHRIISPIKPSKDTALAPCLTSNGVASTFSSLYPLYVALVGLFCDSISPSGGNNDKIHGHLVPLLSFFHEWATNSGSAMDYKLDVMDYIYHEMTDAMFNRLSIPFSPYIMMLIKHILPHEEFVSDLVGVHKP